MCEGPHTDQMAHNFYMLHLTCPLTQIIWLIPWEYCRCLITACWMNERYWKFREIRVSSYRAKHGNRSSLKHTIERNEDWIRCSHPRTDQACFPGSGTQRGLAVRHSEHKDLPSAISEGWVNADPPGAFANSPLTLFQDTIIGPVATRKSPWEQLELIKNFRPKEPRIEFSSILHSILS